MDKREPIRFEIFGRLVGAGIRRAHHYKDKEHGGGTGEGRFVPELHTTFSIDAGDGYSSDRQQGGINLYIMQADLVRALAALWWERGLQMFDHEGRDWKDPGRVRFKITFEEVPEDDDKPESWVHTILPH